MRPNPGLALLQALGIDVDRPISGAAITIDETGTVTIAVRYPHLQTIGKDTLQHELQAFELKAINTL